MQVPQGGDVGGPKVRERSSYQNLVTAEQRLNDYKEEKPTSTALFSELQLIHDKLSDFEDLFKLQKESTAGHAVAKLAKIRK